MTYQGKPLPIGSVSFLDSSNQRQASSSISDGTYTIPVKVPVGHVKAIFTTPGSSSGGRRPIVVRNNKRVEKITNIRRATPTDREVLLDVWLRSVQTTHTFVSNEDIQSMIPQVREYLSSSEPEF